MSSHSFIFLPGRWIGEGRVGFSASSDTLHFYTQWQINPIEGSVIQCTQEVDMPGTDKSLNTFAISEITAVSFVINLQNDILGKVQGRGIIEPKTIAWEFHGQGTLEGFEVYEMQENGDYMMHAEYASQAQFRTIIDGRIWKKDT